MGPDGLPICQSHDGCFADTIAVNSITVTLCFYPEALRVCWHVLVRAFFMCATPSVCWVFFLFFFFFSIPAVRDWQVPVIWWRCAPCRALWLNVAEVFLWKPEELKSQVRRLRWSQRQRSRRTSAVQLCKLKLCQHFFFLFCILSWCLPSPGGERSEDIFHHEENILFLHTMLAIIKNTNLFIY